LANTVRAACALAGLPMPSFDDRRQVTDDG
jgi:hypothetical protein